MPFRKLQWLFPIAVTLHNSEEAACTPKWASVHSKQLPLHPGAAKIWIGLLLLTVAAFVVTYLSAQKGKQSVWAYLLFGYAAAMLLNVLIPHIPARLILAEYTPGVVTALDQPASHDHSLVPGGTRTVGVWNESNRLRCGGSARHRRGDFGAVPAYLGVFSSADPAASLGTGLPDARSHTPTGLSTADSGCYRRNELACFSNPLPPFTMQQVLGHAHLICGHVSGAPPRGEPAGRLK